MFVQSQLGDNCWNADNVCMYPNQSQGDYMVIKYNHNSAETLLLIH